MPPVLGGWQQDCAWEVQGELQLRVPGVGISSAEGGSSGTGARQGAEHFLSQGSAQGWVSLMVFSFPSSQDSVRAEKASRGGRALPRSRSRPAQTGTMETSG